MQEESSLKCEKCRQRVNARVSDHKVLDGIALGVECGCSDKYIFDFREYDLSVGNESTE